MFYEKFVSKEGEYGSIGNRISNRYPDFVHNELDVVSREFSHACDAGRTELRRPK